MLVVIDYGMSNLRSVSKACETLGFPAAITGDPRLIEKAKMAILPGVGAFGHAMEELNSRGLTPVIKDFASSGKPLLGICLGLQLLFDRSEESPDINGLGILSGQVLRFQDRKDLKVPHMGWNQLKIHNSNCPILSGIPEGSYVYFVHSYYAIAGKDSIVGAFCSHGDPFVAVAWNRNVFGVQFHPEKSQASGLKILENFLKL